MKDKKQPIQKLDLVQVRLVKEKSILYEVEANSPAMASCVIHPFFKGLDREAFYVLSLDSACHPLNVNLVSIGSINASYAEPREVFKAAMLSNAARIIVAHNHPSGTKKASEADILVTKRIKEAGRILGINLEDHLIFYGDEVGEYTSLRDLGHI